MELFLASNSLYVSTDARACNHKSKQNVCVQYAAAEEKEEVSWWREMKCGIRQLMPKFNLIECKLMQFVTENKKEIKMKCLPTTKTAAEAAIEN